MHPDLRAQLERIFGSIALVSPASWTCAGEVTEVQPEQLPAKLTAFLYRRCYIRWFSDPAPENPGDDLTGALREAHPGRPRRDMGWRVIEPLEDGWVIARKGGAARRFAPGRYLVLEGGLGTAKKDQALLVWPGRESLTIQPEYYYAFGDTAGECDEGEDLLRFYWNVTAEGAPRLLRALVERLNYFQTPFHCKLPRFRHSYPRRDAAVLYLNRRYYRIAAMIAAAVHAQLRDSLCDPTPLFTKRLAPGLALAEDPHESFGMHRCAILAEAFLTAYRNGLTTPDDQVREFDRQFALRGLDLNRPYLNHGSRDEYDFS